VDEHEEGPSAMMRKVDRDRDRDERRGFDRGDRDRGDRDRGERGERRRDREARPRDEEAPATAEQE
jgi:small subunit ribosomal protein S6